MPTFLFTSSAPNSAPGDTQGWQIATPRQEIAPPPACTPNSGKYSTGAALGLFGEYKTCVYGSWQKTVPNILPHQHYRLTAFCRSQKIVDTRKSLFAKLTWLDAHGKPLRSPDYAFVPAPDGSEAHGDWAPIDYTSRAPENAAAVTIDFGLRWAPVGSAWFDDIQLTPVPAPSTRTIKVASAFINMQRGDSPSAEQSVARFIKLVDEKLPKNTDILCLSEGITAAGTGKPYADVAEAVPGGPTHQTLSALAQRHHCYVVAGIYERQVGTVYNTALLFDRSGKLVGKYQKTNLPREESEGGLTPGDTYPVFDTDFGKIGIMICWDVQFPEPARALALQGAELILLPIAGGNETLTRARAIENHLYLVTSSYHMKNMILNPLGNSLAESPAKESGLISADISLGQQFIQPWLSDMKNRTWMERRGDISSRLGEPARSRDVAPQKNEPPIPFTLAPAHPRVYITAAQLPALRQRAQTSNQSELNSLLAFYKDKASDSGHAGDFTEPTSKLALLYLLTADPAHARACIRSVEKLLAIDVEGTYFPTQRRVRALALAYDWCHDAMSDSFRQKIARSIEAYVQAAVDSGEAIMENSGLAGHVANMIPHFLAAGIAIGDEGNGRSLITACLRWTEKFLANSKFFLESASYQQSYPYTCAYVAEIAAIFQLLETGLGQTPHKDHPWFQNTIPWWLYPLRSDQTFFRFGDYFCSSPLFQNGSYYRPIAYIANRYNDPHARWFAEQFDLKAKNGGGDEFHLLLFPASTPESSPAQAPDNLPRTRYFEKMGIAIARGDWNIMHGPDTGGTVAAFKCSPHYLHNHCHRDANSVTLYHKGDLALDSGVYDDYESAHWYNYYIRTIAHNSIVIHDPAERFISRNRPQSNDGGQRFINHPHWGPNDYTNFLAGKFKDGTILAYRESKDHSYVCGDASNCYAPHKLKKFLRHVTFLLDHPHKSAVSLLILDEIELAKDGLAPRFLLHSTNEPQLTNNTINITQGQGRLTTTFLTPVTLEKIGGPGKEFLVDGKNYPLTHMPKGPHTPGAWRTEATPTQPDPTNPRLFHLLTLLTPTDLPAPMPPAPQLQKISDTWILQQAPLTVALFRNKPPTNLPGSRQLLIPLASTS